MPKVSELNSINMGPLEVGTIEAVRKEPFALLDSFEWCDVDLNNEEQAK